MTRVVATTERLTLREWAPDDGDRFYNIMNTPAVMRHLGGVQDRATWEAALDRILGFQRQYGHTFWIVERREDGQLIGFCGLKRVNAEGTDLVGEFEVGWRLRESAWGHGYAKEAAIAALDLGFGRFAAPRIVALTIPANRSSQGLMERLGMTRRPDLDFIDPRHGPDLNPTIVWSIAAQEWAAARRQALA